LQEKFGAVFLVHPVYMIQLGSSEVMLCSVVKVVAGCWQSVNQSTKSQRAVFSLHWT